MKHNLSKWLRHTGMASLLLCLSSVTHAEMISIAWPAEPTAEAALQNAKDAVEPYIVRTGSIAFNTDTFFPSAPANQPRKVTSASLVAKQLSIEPFPGQSYLVNITSEAINQQGVLSLLGTLQGQELSTFSMTVSPEGFLISLQDMSTGHNFRMTGTTESGLGRVQEIDGSKIYYHNPPPLIPPQAN